MKTLTRVVVTGAAAALLVTPAAAPASAQIQDPVVRPVIVQHMADAFPTEVAAHREAMTAHRAQRKAARQSIRDTYRASTLIQEYQLRVKLAKATTREDSQAAIRQYLWQTRSERQSAVNSVRSVNEAFFESARQTHNALYQALAK